MDTIAGLAALVLARGAKAHRFLVAVAGPPAAGKSTVANELALELQGLGQSATVIPMDGFHYDDAVLDRLGLRARKGSPPTFDAAGFKVLVQRLRAGEPDIAIPHFDRALELSRAASELVSADVKFLIIEGNYLLLDEEPWASMLPLFDMTVFLDVPIDELDRRLVARWDHYGRDKAAARQWIDTNDLPNIRQVLEHSNITDIRYTPA
ncbi:MAG: nucleoside/nucleotide kinase family protein [Rhizobiaceae bacterium]